MLMEEHQTEVAPWDRIFFFFYIFINKMEKEKERNGMRETQNQTID